MSNKPTQTAVPKLRFPEFRDAGKWQEKPLHTLAKKVTSKNKDEGITRVLTNSAANGVVDQRDFFDKDIANKSNLSGYFIVKEGDYVYNPRISNIAPVGPISKNKLALGIMSPLYTVFRFNNADNDFYEQYFKFTHWHSYIHQVSNSGARHDRISITSSEFMDMPLPCPKPEEQQKIADCLSSVDELIATEGQKLEVLQDHKKGLMQQLFPAEGKTLPKLRFPEFRDTESWKEEKLEKLYSFKSTNSLSREKLTLSKSKVKNIHYGDIHTKYSSHFDVDKEEVPYVIESESLEKVKSESFCKEGDVIFADASENMDDIGKCLEIVNLNNEKLLSGLHTILARQKKDRLIVGFAGYLFQSHRMRTKIQNEAQGAKVLGISGSRLASIDICYPKDKNEQQKIADCLSSVDELIATEVQKLKALREYKKGLMQQLFPSAEEVMG